MNWALLGGSLAGVLALAGTAWLLKLGGGGIGDMAAAKTAAEDALSGFAAADAIVAEDGHAALVIGTDGSVALLKLHGAQIAARRLYPPLSIARGGGLAYIDSGERAFGRIAIPDGDKLLTLV